MQTDRNLLFGVLAFQDEYIDLTQLAAICRAWAADKSRSIPQLLVERQWLSEQGRNELERKVERKLKRFVGDVHSTLGAVADGAVRDILKQVHDPDISESLSSWPDSVCIASWLTSTDSIHFAVPSRFGRSWSPSIVRIASHRHFISHELSVESKP